MVDDFYRETEKYLLDLKEERNPETFEDFSRLAFEMTKFVQVTFIKHTSLDQSGSLSVHSVNVALLALQIAKDRKLNISMSSLALGCLLHDIGKIYIHEDILMKPSSLNPIERAIVDTHTSIGRSVAKNHIHNKLILDIIADHHNIFKYKKEEMVNSENEAVYLCGVCDIVDAMLSFRPYKNPMSKASVLEEIAKKGEASILKQVNLVIGDKAELEKKYIETGLIAVSG